MTQSTLGFDLDFLLYDPNCEFDILCDEYDRTGVLSERHFTYLKENASCPCCDRKPETVNPLPPGWCWDAMFNRWCWCPEWNSPMELT